MITEAVKKVKFKAASDAAAKAEREKDYEQAAKTWGLALVYAKKEVNQKWCQGRQDFCLRMLKKPF
ncbi:ANR family transcriptional regulator [[Pasteurella] aerogenes]|nr:ANR family transcriptional regulator [[Pasteurella] aerogenes]